MSASPAAPLPITAAERETLVALARSQAAPRRQVLRAKALLMAADGEANTRIAKEIGVTPVTVRGWRRRFSEDGLAKLGQVRKGRGRKPTITDEQVAQIVRLSTEETPPGHTLVMSHDGQACGRESFCSATDLVGSGDQAASGGHLQGVH